MTAVRHADWLNENSNRRFPLVDTATAGVSDGLLVDLAIPAPLSIDPSKVYVKGVHGYVDIVVIFFGNAVTTDTVGACTIFLKDHELNKSYPVVGQGELEGSIGRVNIGTRDALNDAASRVAEFTPAEAMLVPSVVRPSLRGITGVGVSGATALSGNVTLVPGAGVELVIDEETNTITINSTCVAPAPFNDDCGCGTGSGAGEEETRPAIRSLNGVSADSEGIFNIVGLGGVSVSSSGNAIIIEDTTTLPCCGPDQLDQLYIALDAVSKESTDVRAAVSSLAATIASYKAAIDAAQSNAPEA